LLCSVFSDTKVSTKKEPPWYSLTSPLEQSVVNDLCEKLDIRVGERKSLCSGEEIYADEFLGAIRRTFPKGSSYEMVQDKLSDYQSRIVKPEGGYYFNVFYDFRGDEVIEIRINFQNNELFRVGSTQNYDDWFPGQIKYLTEEAQKNN